MSVGSCRARLLLPLLLAGDEDGRPFRFLSGPARRLVPPSPAAQVPPRFRALRPLISPLDRSSLSAVHQSIPFATKPNSTLLLPSTPKEGALWCHLVDRRCKSFFPPYRHSCVQSRTLPCCYQPNHKLAVCCNRVGPIPFVLQVHHAVPLVARTELCLLATSYILHYAKSAAAWCNRGGGISCWSSP